MMPQAANCPPESSPEREARIQALLTQLGPLFEQTARAMAEQLVDLPAPLLFGDIEFVLRELAHRLAAGAHQAELDARQKKTATRAPASSARSAASTPSSTTTTRSAS